MHEGTGPLHGMNGPAVLKRYHGIAGYCRTDALTNIDTMAMVWHDTKPY
jgi:hypothetical protein